MSRVSRLLPVLFQYQLLLKLYHWQTHSYARHKASDELHEHLVAFMDLLVNTTKAFMVESTLERLVYPFMICRIPTPFDYCLN